MTNTNKRKIFNDPVYGFITIPYEIIFELIEHPYFQRLRRIKQLSMTDYVYPGALHTRFHHALGAMHLMTQAIEVLRSKNVDINEEESEAACIAILLHDIGHGPFSHTLEHTILNLHHETLSSMFMATLNEEFNGKLSMAIEIFEGRYPKKFLHQLISGQLDVDRLDYLNRDSYFTGVSEGVVGCDRIIKMLAVRDNELVVEEKGIYSVEKFLIARRLMYWQVYLHKTVLVAEQMLVKTLQRAKYLAKKGVELDVSAPLKFFLYENFEKNALKNLENKKIISTFALLDDFDVISAIKSFTSSYDNTLAFLASHVINRNLFRIELANVAFSDEYIKDKLHTFTPFLKENDLEESYILFTGKETNSAYSKKKDEIMILHKNYEKVPMSSITEPHIQTKNVTKYYFCYPKI